MRKETVELPKFSNSLLLPQKSTIFFQGSRNLILMFKKIKSLPDLECRLGAYEADNVIKFHVIIS